MSDAFLSPGRHHAVLKEWRRIGKGQDARFFLEHRQAVIESLEGRSPPQAVLLSRELHRQDPPSWERLARARSGVPWYLVDSERLDQLTSVPACSGLCGLFAPRPVPVSALLERRLVLVAWELSDPGNLGTLIRLVQALGDGALLAVGGCQPWASKVARSSAGALLKADVARVGVSEALESLRILRQSGFALYGAFPRAATRLSQLCWEGKSALVLGNETRGLPESLQALATPFAIPMASDVESLNVAMTGAIVCWEWRRSLPRDRKTMGEPFVLVTTS